MPFRSRGIPLESDTHRWSQRIKRVLKAAGVTKVHLVEKSGVPAYDKNGRPVLKRTNVKMFRHTFAVSYLRAGGNLFYLSKILGQRDHNGEVPAKRRRG